MEYKISTCASLHPNGIRFTLNLDLFNDGYICNFKKYYLIDELCKLNIEIDLYYEAEDRSVFGYVLYSKSDLNHAIKILEISIKNRLIFS